MARIRSVIIRESLQELEELRAYYQGKPEAMRLLFLSLLKSSSDSTVASAAAKAGIGERRGRYWWDAYRKHGLQGLLDRRAWGKALLPELDPGSLYVDKALHGKIKQDYTTGDPVIAFINEVSRLVLSYTQKALAEELKAVLLRYLHDIDYVVINIRYGVDVNNIDSGTVHVLRQHVSSEGGIENVSSSSREYQYTYKQLIEEGKRQGFPFERYHSPPFGIDFYLDSGRRQRLKDESVDTYIGSVILLREIGKNPISSSTIDFMERMRPFFTLMMTSIIAKDQLQQPVQDSLAKMVDKIAGDAELTLRESRVLALGLVGNSHSEISRLLHVSLNTVQSHMKNIYQKTNVNKLSELFAKYFTSLQLEQERGEGES